MQLTADDMRVRRSRKARRARRAAVTTIAGIGALLVSSLSFAAPASHGTVRPHLIDPQLRAELTMAAAGEQVDYLITLGDAPDLDPIVGDRDAVVEALKQTARASQRPVVERLRAEGATVLNTFWLANQVLVRSAAETVTDITAMAGVTQVLPVSEFQVPEPEPLDEVSPSTVDDRTWGVDLVGAHRVWDELGIDGSGVRVAVLDTGVQATHPDLAGALATDDTADPTYPGGWMEWDSTGTPVSSSPRDTQNHGTHVSGTVVGGNASGLHIGVAPGAELMHGLVLPGGSGSTPQIVAGMQWAIAPYDAAGNPAGQPADIVNMSFGPQTGGVNDALVEPIRNMYAAGVLPVASAGNCGEECHGSPGDVLEALAVGATDASDDIAAFSSGGLAEIGDFADPPAEWPDTWTVPDVSAPGVDVISSVARSFGSPHGVMSGTSMAAPHVAGAAALMLSGNPALTPGEIVDALVETSFFDTRHGDQRPNTRFGHGRIDAFQSVSRVALDTGVAGTVVDADTGEAVAGAQVTVVEAGMSLRTVADGGFEFRLPPGSYSLDVSWSGRVVTTVADVVIDEAVTAVDVALSGAAGHVHDAETGDPVAGAEVSVAGTGITTSTDADGAYRLYLRPDDYTLEIRTFGYDPAAVPVAVAAGEVVTADVALLLLPTGTVTGTVTFADSGHPVPGVAVELVGGGRSATTTADGTYTISDVPIGDHAVAARPELFDEPPVEDVTIDAGGTVTRDFPLECGGNCAGQWLARHDGPQAEGFDVATDVAISPDGSRTYVTGGEGTFGDRDFATIAYDTVTGRQLWIARYDGPVHGQDSARSLMVSADGTRVFVIGASPGNGGGGTSGVDYATVAYDAATGAEVWVARYDGPGAGFDNPRALGLSPDGTQVFVTGQSSADGPPAHTEYATVAYDAATGAEAWVASYNGPGAGFDAAFAMVVDPDGTRVFVTGQSPGKGSGWDYATVAYDAATGDETWVARYDGPGSAGDQASAAAMTPDGSLLLVSGTSQGGGTGGADYATLAYDPDSGDETWVARYDGPAGNLDEASAVTVGPDGSAVYVTGRSRTGADRGAVDYATVAYDTTGGAPLWTSRYDGPGAGADEASDIAVSPDGARVVVTGSSAGDGGGVDYGTVSYDAGSGAQVWDARYDGPASDSDAASAVTVTPDGSHVVVTGKSELGFGDDPLIAPSVYATVAYDAEGSRRSPVFVAHDLSLAPSVTSPGEKVRVAATVTNVGTGSGAYAATLVVDGVAQEATTIELDSGEDATAEWSVARDEPAPYQVRVGHAAARLHVVACDVTITGSHVGPLTVTDGVTCLTDGATVSGRVTVRAGAGLLATGAEIRGPVTADGAAVVGLRGTRVLGPVSVTGTTRAVSVVNSRTGAVRVIGNTTGESPFVMTGNRISGGLACSGNRPAPVDGGVPNTVTGRTTGQCLGF